MINTSQLEQDGTYQDVELNGKIIVKGLCPVSCEKRWNEIKPVLRGRNVIADIGSDSGFFTKRIANEFTTSIVLSFEQSEKALVQKELLKAEKTKNVILFNQKFWVSEMERLAQSCEAIDTIMFLSVFHHYPPEESLKMLDLIFKNIPGLITEHPVLNPVKDNKFPDRTDDFVQNQYSNFQKELIKRFQRVNFLGKTTLQGVEDRVIYHSHNPHLIRPSLVSVIPDTIEYDPRKMTNKLEYWFEHWKLYRKWEPTDDDYFRPSESWKHGFSAYDAMQFNCIYPETDWWKKESEKAYVEMIEMGLNVTEIGPTNLIFTTGGLQVVDWNHNNPHYSKKVAYKEVDKLIKFYDTKRLS